MKTKTIVITLLAAGLLSTSGWALYQMGVKNGMLNPAPAAVTSKPASTSASTPAANALIDPSTWGIAQGEAATRRHIDAGIKGGDVDPVTGRSVLYYHDPMVPGKKFEAPGKSPFMDMMLVPAYAGAQGADSGTVAVSPRIQQNLGLRTAEVTSGQLVSQVTAIGTVAWNERGQFTVQARANGFVEKLHVKATLDKVVKGQPLLDVYVPQWIAAQEDYLVAKGLQGEALAPLVDASLQRMRQAGMSDVQIDKVKRTGTVHARMTVLAPTSGVVTELVAREGSTVMPGTPLMRIQETSTVWVQAEVPESQVAQVAVGAQVSAQTPGRPGEVFKGQVQALLPEVNTTTRTRKARMELSNAQEQLVPGMLVQMTITQSPQPSKTPHAQQAQAAPLPTLVPSEALVRTGKRTLVMVVEQNSFRPVEVMTGREQNDQVEILSGLQPGQKIVLSGQFLIDSEANLKGVQARSPSAQAPDTTNMTSATPVTYRTPARVEAMDGDTLTVTHPPVPALQWPAMTMDFKLAPGVRAETLSVGADIEIEFQMQDGDVPRIMGWQAPSAPQASKPPQGNPTPRGTP